MSDYISAAKSYCNEEVSVIQAIRTKAIGAIREPIEKGVCAELSTEQCKRIEKIDRMAQQIIDEIKAFWDTETTSSRTQVEIAKTVGTLNGMLVPSPILAPIIGRYTAGKLSLSDVKNKIEQLAQERRKNGYAALCSKLVLLVTM